MRYDLITSETGRRGADITADGLGDITIFKKRVTRHEAHEFDNKIRNLTTKIIVLSKRLGKAKGAAREKLSDEIFDVNAEFICARIDGITPEQLAALDVGDVAEISTLANKLFEENFEAKKNG